MRIETVIVLLVFMFIAYCVMTYKKLISQTHKLHALAIEIKIQKDKDANTDVKRREHNAIARHYNHTLSSFVGKKIAKRLHYTEKELIEKT